MAVASDTIAISPKLRVVKASRGFFATVLGFFCLGRPEPESGDAAPLLAEFDDASDIARSDGQSELRW